MTAAPVRNLLLGAVLLVCAWVPAATLAAPHPASSARSVEAPAHARFHQVRHAERVAIDGCPRVARLHQR